MKTVTFYVIRTRKRSQCKARSITLVEMDFLHRKVILTALFCTVCVFQPKHQANHQKFGLHSQCWWSIRGLQLLKSSQLGPHLEISKALTAVQDSAYQSNTIFHFYFVTIRDTSVRYGEAQIALKDIFDLGTVSQGFRDSTVENFLYDSSVTKVFQLKFYSSQTSRKFLCHPHRHDNFEGNVSKGFGKANSYGTTKNT